jgi:hypothetical protein
MPFASPLVLPATVRTSTAKAVVVAEGDTLVLSEPDGEPDGVDDARSDPGVGERYV